MAYNPQHNAAIYKELSADLGIDSFRIYEAVTSMFRIVVKEMDDGGTRRIRLPYLGLFMCKQARLEKLGLVPSTGTTTTDNGITERQHIDGEELLGDVPSSEDS